jgi:putative ATP-binding cassette transporter
MELLSLLRFLLSKARRPVIYMVTAGLLSGLFSAAFVALITRALQQLEHVPAWLILAFGAAIAGKIAASFVSQLLLVKLSQGTVLELSLDLCRKILRAPLRTLEHRGGAQLLASLTDDVTAVTWAVQCVPQLVMHLSVLLGCAVYLAWLSWQVFLALLLVTVLCVLIYYRLHQAAVVRIESARVARGRLMEHFRSLTMGIKELLLHRARRTEFVEADLKQSAEAYRDSNVAASTGYAIADSWIQLLYYALIGLLLFAFPRVLGADPAALTGYVFAMLYLINPIYGIVGALPPVARGQVALRRIQQLGVSLDERPPQEGEPAEAPEVDAVLEMRGVRFAYESQADGRESFVLGPFDFDLRPGELVFVVGGNGSGKSTFVKVIAGLYEPSAGSIQLGSMPIDANNRECLRERFSIVFSEPYLFERLLGMRAADADAAAQRYLQLLQIDAKVSVRSGAFSTTELSQGQRKRLALVVAYLEDRGFYIFDEWAADQDPNYKRVFYTVLLPELRARGKGVVVVTHDDRYFHLGDRVVKLEDGKVVAALPTERPVPTAVQ